MRYQHEIVVRCDGCGRQSTTVREVSSFVVAGPQGQPMPQEVARIHRPKGWRSGQLTPSVVVPGVVNGLDPFGPADELANRIGAPVPILHCVSCVEQAERPKLAVVTS